MALFDRIKQMVYQRAMDKRSAPASGLSQRMNLQRAQSIALIFGLDPQAPQLHPAILQLRRQLLEAQKAVKLLGFAPSKQPLETEFDCLTLKDLDWVGMLKSPVADKFLAQPYDILICADLEPHPVLDYLAAHAQAAIKVGYAPAAAGQDWYNLVLDCPAELKRYLDQAQHYLKIINAD